jgi:hypothetical protein
VVTSKSWGDFEKRDEPLITIGIEEPGHYQIQHEMPLSVFISKIKECIEEIQ